MGRKYIVTTLFTILGIFALLLGLFLVITGGSEQATRAGIAVIVSGSIFLVLGLFAFVNRW